MSNSKRKCKQCGAYFPSTSMVKFPSGSFCSLEHASEWALNHRQKSHEKIKRQKAYDDKAEKRKRRESDLERLKSVQNISFFHKKAQSAFNAYIRERDKGNSCISCGKPDNGNHQRHASHYRSVGACSSLRYDENNVHAACSVCNNYLSGNVANYRLALVDKFGLELVEWLESQPKACKWTREQLEEVERKYKAMTKGVRCKRQH